MTPASMGGDPTGRHDSWAALNAAIHVCMNQSAISPNGFFPGLDTSPQFGPIRDMGGCNVDLEGGEFKISKPLHLPEMNANMQFGHGSLVATKDFVGDFLFIIGVKGSCKFPQGSCNIDINFPELFLDGARVASGMQINNVMGVTIGPGGYFLNFTAYGLQINAGHEVMMDRVWMGETNFDYDHEKHGSRPNATAIQINGNDHYILNSIIFSSKIGLEVHGAADYITGVHVWFPVNHAVHFPDTMAFHVTGGGNRFNGCYIDGGRAVFIGSALQRNIWTNGFECCQNGAAAPGTPSSGITLVGDKVGPGLQIMNNEFGGGQVFYRSKPWPGYPGVGDGGRNCTAWNISANTKACQGLSHSRAGSTSLDHCESVCCNDPDCSVYQWCGPGGGCEGASGTEAQCWIGKLSDCDHGTRRGWTGKGDPNTPNTAKVTGVRIVHNAKGGKGTQATLSLTQKAATKWEFDFCDLLIFPVIAIARVHVVAAEGFPTAVSRPTTNCKLLVETQTAVTGTITVDVDSSTPSSSFV